MAEYTHFIPQNIAPKNAHRIICFDENGNRIGRIGLYDLKQPNGEKLYSFGAISDVHLGNDYPTSTDDFRRALNYFKNKNVAFIGVCGDCTAYGLDRDYQKWSKIKEEFTDLTLYEVAGNHDATNAGIDNTEWKNCIGKELFYTVKQGDDLFIFLSMNIWSKNDTDYGAFDEKDLDSLQDTLGANSNKRIFLFQHCFYRYGSGNPNDSYRYDLMSGTSGQRFFNIIKNNKNVIWFHGHSHIIFETQEQYPISNYDNILGCHSIHVPSLTQPKHLVNGESEEIDESNGTSVYSQGYVVDVYKNHIILNGINFVTGEQLAIATYCLDTTPKIIAPNTYTDNTGTTTT